MPTTTHHRDPDRTVARGERITLLAAAIRGVLDGLARALLDHFLGT